VITIPPVEPVFSDHDANGGSGSDFDIENFCTDEGKRFTDGGGDFCP
jgi:hypothetical protein